MENTKKLLTLLLLSMICLAFIGNKDALAEELDDTGEIYQQVYEQTLEQMQMKISNGIAVDQSVNATDVLLVNGNEEDEDTISFENTLMPITVQTPITAISVDTTATTQGNYAGKFTITAYCTCSKCCGHSTGVTASGSQAIAWHTVAAGNKFAYGTNLYIPELSNTPSGGHFVVEDRGSKVTNSRIDICLSNHSDAKAFGHRSLDVYIC